MLTPWQRVRLGTTSLGMIVVVAVLVYHHFAGFDWVESLWFVVVTVSSVGYGEDSQFGPRLQLFTVALIVLGLSSAAYTFGGFLHMITEDEVQRALRNRRITRGIDQLSGHVIVCGMGRTGEILAQELTSFEEPFVVIDNDPAKTELAGEDLARLVVTGDATEEGTLETAGITRAKTLISVLPSDADNVFITLTARNLNPKLQIIAKAELRSSEKKLRQAGADRVVMPPVIGGRRMARMVTRPTTARWIDLFTDRSATMGIELDELVIAEQGGLVGKSVADAAVHRDHNLLILAVEHVDGSMDFNPGGNYVFQPNDTVILVGSREDTEAFRKSLKVKRL